MDGFDPRDSENELAKKSAAIFGRVKKLEMQPSPYMKTRVLAQFREKRTKSLRLRFWQVLAVGSGLLAAGLVFVMFAGPTGNGLGHYGAVVDRQIAIRLDLSAESPQVAYVEVQLPDGVHFYSKSYPEFASLRTLTLDRPAGSSQSLPIVVLSNQAGVKDVVVKFLGSDKQVIAVRNLKIKFDRRTA